MINAIMKMNEITMRDVNLLFNVEKFAKKFSKMCIAFFIDFFFEYDQIDLTKRCKNLTTFMIFLKLLRFTRLSQKAINFVTQFVRIVIKILKNHFEIRCKSFLNDIDVKKFKFRYDDREIISYI